jgi:hypothetical protein
VFRAQEAVNRGSLTAPTSLACGRNLALQSHFFVFGTRVEIYVTIGQDQCFAETNLDNHVKARSGHLLGGSSGPLFDVLVKGRFPPSVRKIRIHVDVQSLVPVDENGAQYQMRAFRLPFRPELFLQKPITEELTTDRWTGGVDAAPLSGNTMAAELGARFVQFLDCENFAAQGARSACADRHRMVGKFGDERSR